MQHPRLGSLARLAVAFLVAGLAALAGAAEADAGTYRAVQCHPALRAGGADFSWSANSKRYVGRAACGDYGLTIEHEPGRKPTPHGRFGAWRLVAPPGLEIVRAGMRVKAAKQGSHAPQITVGLAGGASKNLSGVTGSWHGVAWTGTAGRSLTARLYCAHRKECGPGRSAHLHLRRVSLTLRDRSKPRLALGGELLEEGSRRGLQELDVDAADAGSGVRALTVEVNGAPLAARTLSCALSGSLALRLSPCPNERTVRFELPTAKGGFRQGPNQVRACVADLAQTADANRACATRVVRVDNACPLSDVGGARLSAHFEGGGERLRVRGNRAVRVVGYVRDATGTPLAGARVCVAARARGTGLAERVLATPRTNAEGRFTARLPAGPSREIRVAHWPDRERALERYLEVRAQAVPRLTLRPKRTLRNGQRVRFHVSLPGPGAGGRRVEIQARARGRWVPVTSGRTDARGRWRGHYRFRSTTGRRTYSFRALVPRQAGYPYEPGRSAVAKARVVGR